MDDQKEQDARWRETLALLGLPADTPQEPVAAPPPAVVAAVPKPSIAPETLAPSPPPPEIVAHEDLVPHMPDAVDEMASDTVVEIFDASELVEPDMGLDEPSDGTEESGPTDDSAAAPAGDDDKPRKGRRRRRRGRRRGGDKPEGEATAPAADKVNVQASTEVAERKAPRQDREPRDRRGPEPRGRGRDERAAPKVIVEDDRWEEEAPIEELEDVDVAQPLPTDDNEELDTLADWDVPSWQDLISSLHRPER